MWQGGSKHFTGNNGTLFVMTSGASMTHADSPSPVLMAWSITNTSSLMRPVSLPAISYKFILD